MANIFVLNIEKEKSCLTLFEGEKVIASRAWAERRDMGEQLFVAIDEILRERGLSAEMVTDFRIETEVSDAFTSVKIAQTVAKTFLFAIKA